MTAIRQFTTLDVSPAERARYWNEMAALRYAGSTVDAAYAGDFIGEMLSWTIGPLAMLRPNTHACRVSRQPAAPDGAGERLILHLQCRGAGRYAQDGRTTLTEPGDAVLCSTARPYVIELTRHETLVVEFPAALLGAGLVAEALGRRLAGSSPSVRILHDFLLSLWQQGYREVHHPGWEDEVAAVFASLLAMALKGASFAAGHRAAPGLAERVQAIVEARLQDPAFSVVHIARECGLSVRAVQKVFAGMGTTPSLYIQERRLARAGDKLLAYPEATITQIAFDHGFNDSAYFARCFRRRHGVTPRAFRSRH